MKNRRKRRRKMNFVGDGGRGFNPNWILIHKQAYGTCAVTQIGSDPGSRNGFLKNYKIIEIVL